MSNITYQKATINDISVLVENRILFGLELSGEQKEEVVLLLKKQLESFLLKTTVDDSCVSFIAKCGEEIAGIGSLLVREQPGNFTNLSGKWGYIMNMYTVPKYRRKGVCKSILDHLVAEGKKIGITAFELHATKEGEKVYVQDGFVYHKEPTLRKFF